MKRPGSSSVYVCLSATVLIMFKQVATITSPHAWFINVIDLPHPLSAVSRVFPRVSNWVQVMIVIFSLLSKDDLSVPS